MNGEYHTTAWVFLSLLVLAIAACNEKVKAQRKVHIERLQEHLTDMQHILGTATICSLLP